MVRGPDDLNSFHRQVLVDDVDGFDSFANEFNRQTEGIKAATTQDNRLVLGTSEGYHALTDLTYSGTPGFDEENLTLEVRDWSALSVSGQDVTVNRAADGTARPLSALLPDAFGPEDLP